MDAKKGAVNVGAVVMLAIAVVGLIVGLVMYQKHNQRLAHAEYVRQEEARLEREKAEAARKAAEEAEQKEAEKKRIERERIEAEREAKKEAARKQAEAAMAEKKRKLEEQESWRKEYETGREMFTERKAKLWIDSEADSKPCLTKGCLTYWCIFDSYDEEKLFYMVTIDNAGKASVVSVDGCTAPKHVDASEFSARCDKRLHAISINGDVWVCGVGKSGKLYNVPDSDEGVVPAAIELKSFYSVIAGFGITFDGTRTRLTLKSKDGKQSIPLGIIAYDDSLDNEKLESAIEEVVSKKKKKASSGVREPSGPKLKRKPKQTVVFYDGELIKKDMRGVTHIPRKFVFKGTTTYKTHDYRTVEEAKRKWEALRDEAIRQEEKIAEINAENERLLEVHASKMSQRAKEVEKSLKVKDGEIDAELKNWLIQIERSRK